MQAWRRAGPWIIPSPARQHVTPCHFPHSVNILQHDNSKRTFEFTLIFLHDYTKWTLLKKMKCAYHNYPVHCEPAGLLLPEALCSVCVFQEGDRLSDEDLFKVLADIKKLSSLQRRIKTMSGKLLTNPQRQKWDSQFTHTVSKQLLIMSLIWARYTKKCHHPIPVSCVPLCVTYTGIIKLDLTPVQDSPIACLSSELIPVKPLVEKNIRPIKEVLEFPPNEVYVPHSMYRWVYTHTHTNSVCSLINSFDLLSGLYPERDTG